MKKKRKIFSTRNFLAGCWELWLHKPEAHGEGHRKKRAGTPGNYLVIRPHKDVSDGFLHVMGNYFRVHRRKQSH